jgi:Ca2+-binding EF-hand superfamily protein
MLCFCRGRRSRVLGIVLLAAGGAAFTSRAVAQAADEAAQTPASLQPADADGDGKITRAEWGRLMQGFSKLDANEDGAIDLAEMQTAAQTSDTPLLMTLADASGDGKVTRTEWTKLAQRFRRMDTNKDGALDLAEVQAVTNAIAEASKKAGPAKPIPVTPTLWRGWIVDGQGENPNGGMAQIELSFVGNRIAGRDVGPTGDSPPNLGIGAYTMTGNGRAGYMDALYIDGPHAGRLCLGMYRMEGDALHWCVSNRTDTRPESFATGNGFYLMIMHRLPAAKTE